MTFEGSNVWETYKQYFLPLVEIKYYNVIIDGRNFFDEPVKKNLITYGNIQKIANGQEDDCTTECLLDSRYFKKYYKLNARDLSQQQKLDADPKAIQQISLTGNLYWDGNIQMFFIIEEVKETALDFSKGTVKILRFNLF